MARKKGVWVVFIFLFNYFHGEYLLLDIKRVKASRPSCNLAVEYIDHSIPREEKVSKKRMMFPIFSSFLIDVSEGFCWSEKYLTHLTWHRWTKPFVIYNYSLPLQLIGRAHWHADNFFCIVNLQVDIKSKWIEKNLKIYHWYDRKPCLPFSALLQIILFMLSNGNSY